MFLTFPAWVRPQICGSNPLVRREQAWWRHKKRTRFVVPSPPLFSLHKRNFEDPLNTKTKHILNFKTSVVDPRRFDHNLRQQVNKFMNMNFLICSRGSSQKQYMRKLNKIKHINKIFIIQGVQQHRLGGSMIQRCQSQCCWCHPTAISSSLFDPLVVPLLVSPVAGVVAPIWRKQDEKRRKKRKKIFFSVTAFFGLLASILYALMFVELDRLFQTVRTLVCTRDITTCSWFCSWFLLPAFRVIFYQAGTVRK